MFRWEERIAEYVRELRHNAMAEEAKARKTTGEERGYWEGSAAAHRVVANYLEVLLREAEVWHGSAVDG